jgi:hypothetical protein
LKFKGDHNIPPWGFFYCSMVDFGDGCQDRMGLIVIPRLKIIVQGNQQLSIKGI